jgi:hypothetical protein
MVRPAMATSDEDDKDDDKGDEHENAEEREEEEGDEKDEADEKEEGEEEESATAKPAAKEAKPAASKPAAAKPAAARPARPKAEGREEVAARPPPSAGLGKSVMLFVLVVGGIALLMLVLGAERGGGGPVIPQWKEGQQVEIDITLVSTDRQDLACASGTEMKGMHCGFETQARRWSKGDPNDDKATLRPYSTTANVNFLGAGVWSEPALLPDKLPNTRFSVKCKFDVAGKMPRADVRWHEGEGWNNVTDWYVGKVSDCKMSSIQN